MTLWNDFLTNKGRVIYKWPHYFPVYERHLARFKNTPCTLLEIGCADGGSLQMWKRYLGPLAKVTGIDIDPKCKSVEDEVYRIKVFTGDQGDRAFLLSVIEEIGDIDIVIDDGSHRGADIMESFDMLYPRVSKSGVYLVEDLHTAYEKEFGDESFVEVCKKLVDGLNEYHKRGTIYASSFTRTTQSMHFYDSMVVFEKGDHPKPASAVYTMGAR